MSNKKKFRTICERCQKPFRTKVKTKKICGTCASPNWLVVPAEDLKKIA